AGATAPCPRLGSLSRRPGEVLSRVTRFDRVSIVLHDETTDMMRLHLVAARVSPRVTDVELPVDEAPAGVAWRTQRPVVIPDIDRESRFATVLEILRSEGMRSHCSVPLTSPLRRLGGLGFTSPHPDAFEPADVEFLQQLAGHVALAVDNALHNEAEQHAQQALARERDQLRLLLEVNNALVSNLEPRALFAAIATCLRRVISHEYTSLAVYSAPRREFDLWAVELPGAQLVNGRTTGPLEGSPAGAAFSAGKAVRFVRRDLEALSADVAGLLLAQGIQSMCCVPLAVHDRQLGTLSLGRLGGEPFSDDEGELVVAGAEPGGLAAAEALGLHGRPALHGRLPADH